MRSVLGYAILAFLIALSVAALFMPLSEVLSAYLGANFTASAALFIAVMFLATVLLPLSTLPLVPLAAPYLGPLSTALLAIVGWSLGAAVDFYIARRFGRPLLLRLVSADRLDYCERLIPERATFWWIIVLRMLVPVDVLSYALGLSQRLSFGTYALATVIGITPFSFIFAYSGDAMFSGKWGLLIALILTGGLILVSGAHLLRRTSR